jgi:DNA uptake protein ComE-like DNA-binding protein
LEELPGVGPVTAAKIIAGRYYTDVEDLLSKGGVPQTTFNKFGQLVFASRVAAHVDASKGLAA